ncbi:ethanolamine ammonia-lyase subunit EutC [Niallia sp. 03133]|uniref:ethanolamine ammonia-lyase subunit EutC n=1 Tax=Niallia sp. 03133 TaxID=3458060 RepID=UPI004044D6B3
MEEKEQLKLLKSFTPARIGEGRTGTRPLTESMLRLRRDHAAAVDAVHGHVDNDFLMKLGLFTVETLSKSREVYLQRPDLGRRISPEGAKMIQERCMHKPQIQIVLSNGLSADAIMANGNDVLPALLDSLAVHDLQSGTPFFVKNGRVACMDHIGELLEPEALVLLIGERPGLASPGSMSAYMCYKPREGMIESDRNVISNIHQKGTPPLEAAAHIGAVLKCMIEQQLSGIHLQV